MGLELEQRVFVESPAYAGQLHDSQTSVSIQPEWSWEFEGFDLRFNVVGFYREDRQDEERSHGDLRELYLYYEQGDWDLLVGINKVFWGVTESRHLVDVINQTDILENIDLEDKLGQPMVNWNWLLGSGQLSLFWLPRFREQAFSGEGGRFRPPFLVNHELTLYESADRDKHQDWSIRYSHVFDAVDLGIAYFDGTSREPRLVQVSGSNVIRPIYDLMQQTGLDFQYTGEAVLLKSEIMYRETRVDAFEASIAGFEYTFYQVFDSAADVGVLVEYLWDGRDSISPSTPFEHDWFIGGRYTLNNIQDTQLLAGVIIDAHHQHTFITVEFERRLGQDFSLQISGQGAVDQSDQDPLFFITQDGFLQFALNYFY